MPCEQLGTMESCPSSYQQAIWFALTPSDQVEKGILVFRYQPVSWTQTKVMLEPIPVVRHQKVS